MTSKHNAKYIPDLTIPALQKHSNGVPRNLAFFLYKGGAKVWINRPSKTIEAHQLGEPIFERLELLIEIHEAIQYRLSLGGSAYSAENSLRALREMYTWAETNDQSLTIDSVQSTFLNWAEALRRRAQDNRNYKYTSAYSRGSHASCILDIILQRKTPLIGLTRLHYKPPCTTAVSPRAEKQNLYETFEFGAFLQDICDGTSLEVVMGSLPIRIPLRSGREIVEWCGYPKQSYLRYIENPPTDQSSDYEWLLYNKCMDTFAAREADKSLRTRFYITNRRIEAELLMFIAQTGMNLAQAHPLKLKHYTYASHLDGYQVREWKPRRQGPVLFEVFSDYKPHFERYLEWRRKIFPDSDLLFPLVSLRGRSREKAPNFSLRDICHKINLKFVPPQLLRNTRVNWLLRQTNDPDLTADMAQHQRETLLKVYERPSQQRAISEIVRFWAKHDPTITRRTPAGPGDCDGSPSLTTPLPAGAPPPDCIRPSGCLWCDKYRDKDNLDYIWSLASFRYLKHIEMSKALAQQRIDNHHPAMQVIHRLSDKLNWFTNSTPKRSSWVEEALARVEEGNYHPDWSTRILGMEGTS